MRQRRLLHSERAISRKFFGFRYYFNSDDDDDGRLYLTSDAPVRRREATQSREVARESDLANAHGNEETTSGHPVGPGQIMEDGMGMPHTASGHGPVGHKHGAERARWAG